MNGLHMLHFDKYHGAGNDFVLIDDRDGAFAKLYTQPLVAKLCKRHLGVGADGLIALRTLPADAKASLEMVYYNSDGELSSFCGNGSRCFVRYAHDLGLLGVGERLKFVANDGLHTGSLSAEGTVTVSMQVLASVQKLSEYRDQVDTGSPHLVEWCTDLPKGDIVAQAQEIRYSPAFTKTGINVNYVLAAPDNQSLRIRTYERGVENETLACGTGVTAAVLSFAERRTLTGRHRIAVHALGGELAVSFERTTSGIVSDVWLHGLAVKVFGGMIDLNAL